MANQMPYRRRCTSRADKAVTSDTSVNRSRLCCGRQNRMIKRPYLFATLFVSLFSFAFCFPTGYIKIVVPGSNPKGKAEPGSSLRQKRYASPSRFEFLPEVFVLSLSSTSQSPQPNLDRDTTTNKKRNNTTNKNRNSSKKITVKNIDKEGNELPLRTVEYRRRKHEWAERYTNQEGLREAFGTNRNKFWGDLDANTARRLYKRLLFPTAISELVLELGDEIVRPEELAPLAYEARKAAKMYVRERCRIPSRVGAYLFDGFRQLRKYGRFQPNGASYEQLWIRYYEENDSSSSSSSTDKEWEDLFGRNGDNNDEDNDDGDTIIDEIYDAITEDEIVKRTCQKILEKSCTTNEAIDRFYLKGVYDDVNAPPIKKGDDIDSVQIFEKNEDPNFKDHGGNTDKIVNMRNSRGQGWRKRKRKKRNDRYNDLLLEKITKTLERDVRKLLEPPPSSLSSPMTSEEGEAIYSEYNETRNECDVRKNNRTSNSSSRDEGNLSSRRMTRQEYHSLKLFAKARKHSQQYQLRDNNSNVSTKRPQFSNNVVHGMSGSVSVTRKDHESFQDNGE